jgi:hypothetical protein
MPIKFVNSKKNAGDKVPEKAKWLATAGIQCERSIFVTVEVPLLGRLLALLDDTWHALRRFDDKHFC